MESKIWMPEENTENDDMETPLDILENYASKLKDDIQSIEGVVTELLSSSRKEVTYTLYLVVPELNNYSYQLIEVVQPNGFTFYPVTMKFYGNTKKGTIEKKNVTHEKFEENLIDFIQNPDTKKILSNLLKQIRVSKKYNK